VKKDGADQRREEMVEMDEDVRDEMSRLRRD